MPPRRSCFSSRFSTSVCSYLFQCHHGVPASVWGEARRPWRFMVSMPPRRSCFSVKGRKFVEYYAGFNATTAFLLPVVVHLPRQRHLAFQCHHGVPASAPGLLREKRRTPVSMPPRRSCFQMKTRSSARIRKGFNATTAFLLRSADELPG